MSDQPSGPIETRSAELVGVSFEQREIELIVMPYETPTTVPYNGKIITEVVSRGAFDGIERRASRVRVNRDHSPERTVGRAISLHPSRKEGLVANVRIARTDLGDETLTLADDGILDASAGFMPMPGGELWEQNGNRRRLTKVWLAHVALTPDPAYADARVLAVRARPAHQSDTPNLDMVKSWRLERRYTRLSS